MLIIKVKMLKKSKFKVRKLVELHREGSTSGTDTEEQTDAAVELVDDMSH
jgi:hypothetical protein